MRPNLTGNFPRFCFFNWCCVKCFFVFWQCWRRDTKTLLINNCSTQPQTYCQNHRSIQTQISSSSMKENMTTLEVNKLYASGKKKKKKKCQMPDFKKSRCVTVEMFASKLNGGSHVSSSAVQWRKTWPLQRQQFNSRLLSLTAWLTHLYKGLLTLNGNNCLFVYWEQFILIYTGCYKVLFCYFPPCLSQTEDNGFVVVVVTEHGINRTHFS